jgi:4-hydroxy-tetrahydrodipicolinate reductase
MLKVIVSGVAGKMGSTILRRVLMDSSLKLAGALEREGHLWLGKDAGNVMGFDKAGVIVTDKFPQMRGDVIIDFTTKEATFSLLDLAVKNKISMVIGTTGLNEKDREEITKASKKIPIVFSPNMSIGINLLFKLLPEAVKVLGDEYDIEIYEEHHRHKKDAPSGTALAFGEIIAKSFGKELKDVGVFERKGITGERKKGTIGIQSIRAGDIVGDHTVLFATDGERIEFTHRATSRDNFARGAIRAAKWVVQQKPGLYSMMDVLGIK